jgi:hypothetical protein
MSFITNIIKRRYPRLSRSYDSVVKNPLIAELWKNIITILKIAFSFLMAIAILIPILYISKLILLGPSNFDEVITFGERIGLFLVAITALAFTYAAVLEKPKRDDIIKSGEYLFKSFLSFFIGMVFAIYLRNSLSITVPPFYMTQADFNQNKILSFYALIISVFVMIYSVYPFLRGIVILLAALWSGRRKA